MENPAPPATMEIKEVRAMLERLREITGRADPDQVAPPRWIAGMHEALGAVAAREHVGRYRLDGLQGINMGFLHRPLRLDLSEFDHLIAEPSVRQEHARPRTPMTLAPGSTT